MVDAQCAPRAGPFTEGDAGRLAISCETVCHGAPEQTSVREGQPGEVPVRFRRHGCHYEDPVSLVRSDATCGVARVYTFTVPSPGRYRIAGRWVEVSGEPLACPEPPPEVQVRLDAKEAAKAAERRESERKAAERRASEWDEAKRDWNAELTAASSVTLIPRDGEPRALLGGELRVGFRRTKRYEKSSGGGGKGFSISTSEGARWCMPIVMCMAFGALLAPPSSFVGNDQGLDLVGRVGRSFQPGLDVVTAEVGLRPFLRVAADNRLRSQSLVGSFLPEVGLHLHDGGPSAFYARWSAYPIDVLLGRRFAISWDGPLLGLVVPFDGTAVAPTLGTGLSLTGIFDAE